MAKCGLKMEISMLGTGKKTSPMVMEFYSLAPKQVIVSFYNSQNSCILVFLKKVNLMELAS